MQLLAAAALVQRRAVSCVRLLQGIQGTLATTGEGDCASRAVVRRAGDTAAFELEEKLVVVERSNLAARMGRDRGSTTAEQNTGVK